LKGIKAEGLLKITGIGECRKRGNISKVVKDRDIVTASC